jgi:phosphoserine phosphatase
LAEPLRRKLGFDGVHANTLEVAAGKLTGGLTGPVVDAAAKRAYLLETCAKLGFAPANVAAVGDGANDTPMLTAAGMAVGFKPKKILLPHLHAQDARGDHRFLAPLLFGRDLAITRGQR